MRRLPVVSGQAPRGDDVDVVRFLSQSEGGDWLACGVRAYSRWVLGLRDSGDESPRQQVGSIGHAILADRAAARHRGVRRDPAAAAGAEAARRRWPNGWVDGLSQAEAAADLVARDMGLDDACLVPDLYSCTGGPLAEVRLHAPWGKVAWAFKDGPTMSRGWSDVTHCSAVMRRFDGIEGQPDLVYLPDGPGGVTAIVDYKFRQRPDLGGAGEPGGASLLPDRQGAWYLTILRALGMQSPGGFEFRQVNVYAGVWLTVDDFMDAASGRGARDLVTTHDLPTRDLSRMGDAGGMVTAEVWSEAHRLLAQRRHDLRQSVASRDAAGRKFRSQPMLSAAEEADARRMVETLRAHRPVVVRRVRADPQVCREVVRDVIVGVEGPLSLALRGVTPARHLQTYPGSPCVRQWGCPVSVPCQSSLGTNSVADALQQAAEDAMDAREAARETEAAYA